MTARFGPAGNSQSFYDQGYKASIQMPGFLAEKGLNAYEYQCSRGIRISSKTAQELGREAQKNDIALSIHAPYYINLASAEEKSINNSKDYLLKSLEVAQWMGATKIVFHPGGAAKIERREAMLNASRALERILDEAYSRGLDGIFLCPETMGKKNQLGSLDEVLELTKIDPRRIRPAIDFGHLHAITGGSLKTKEDFCIILEKIGAALGAEVLKSFHAHFSPIEFTKAGEKKHWNLCDSQFGPEFLYLAEVIADWNLSPTIICESAGHQVEDARVFRNIYEDLSSRSLKVK